MTTPARPRPATAADVEAVVDLVESAYRGESSQAGWTTEADLLGGRRTDAEMVRDLVTDPDSVLLVLDDDAEPGRLLACCHVQRRTGTAADAAGGTASTTGYFGLFAVRPTAQGRGYGGALLRAAEALVAEWAVRRIELTVLSHRPELLAWYERRGFALTGRELPFPGYEDDRYGVPRREDLVLREMVKQLAG